MTAASPGTSPAVTSAVGVDDRRRASLFDWKRACGVTSFSRPSVYVAIDAQLLAGLHVQDALGRLDADARRRAARRREPTGIPAAIQPRSVS